MSTIVFVVPSLKTGGGNRVFFELANKLIGRYNVEIIYPNNSAEGNTFSINPEINLKPIGTLTNNKFNKLWNVRRVIYYLNIRHKKDIIIITDPIFSLFSKFIKSKKLYRFIQADDYRIFDDGAILGKGILLKGYKSLCLYSYRYKMKFIFNSKYVYEKFCKDSGRTDVSYNLVHPAIDHNIFNINTKLSSVSDKITICIVARKHPLKGFKTFLNSWNTLSSEMKNRIDKVIIISHDDLSDFDLSGMNIEKPSSDIEIARAYCKSDIFISTSWREGFGLPPLEAMACGCACIISDSGGVNEYAVPNRNCLMFTPKDEKMLVQEVELLINDTSLRKKLSDFGREDSFNFNWDKSSEQLIEIINKKSGVQ